MLTAIRSQTSVILFEMSACWSGVKLSPPLQDGSTWSLLAGLHVHVSRRGFLSGDPLTFLQRAARRFNWWSCWCVVHRSDGETTWWIVMRLCFRRSRSPQDKTSWDVTTLVILRLFNIHTAAPSRTSSGQMPSVPHWISCQMSQQGRFTKLTTANFI